MYNIHLFLDALWSVWMLKYVLFWIYLWQLKEYHVGRFIDHFRTHKGKKLLFSYEQIFKVVLLALFLTVIVPYSYLFCVLILLYLAEAVIFLRNIYRNNFKRPAATLKTIFLTVASFFFVAVFLIRMIGMRSSVQPIWLLIFDILTPLFISAVVLIFQPFFVAVRNNTLRRAGNRIEKIKSVSGLIVIVITGSYGKTSTKEFLTKILSQKFKVLSTKEHQNSEVGIAKCILEDLEPSHQIFIAEVGAYNKGKVREVCNMIKPKIGVVTGVNEQHMALFGSLKNLLSAEGGGELAAALPKDGILVINGDNKYCLDLYKKTEYKHLNKKIYSLSNKIIDSDIWSDGVSVHKNYVSFVAVDKKGEMAHFNVNVLGKQNVQNLLGAILTAKELGVGFGEAVEACESILPEHAGMVLRTGKHGIEVIDSSYSSNPDGVFADLEYLSVFSGKKVIAMPCLIELGKDSAKIHEKIGKKIGEVCDLAIITSKDKFKSIKRGAVGAGMQEKNILLCDKPQDIYSMITLLCKSGDAVLLEGRVPGKLIDMLIV